MKLRRAVSDTFVARGYRRDGRTLQLPIDDEMSWVIDTGPLSGSDIIPFVGLRHEAVARLRSEILEHPFDAMGAIGGGMAAYFVGRQPKLWRTMDELPAVLDEIEAAQRFLERFASLDRLPGLFDLRAAKSPGWHYTLVAIYLLLRDRERVEEWLRYGEQVDCQHASPVCEQFRTLERNARARI